MDETLYSRRELELIPIQKRAEINLNKKKLQSIPIQKRAGMNANQIFKYKNKDNETKSIYDVIKNIILLTNIRIMRDMLLAYSLEWMLIKIDGNIFL